jgi:PAS domain S-box-containing protein
MPAKSAINPSVCGGGTLQVLFDAMPELFLYIDQDGVVQAVSRKVGEYFGVEPEQLIGQSINAKAEVLARCFTEFMTYHEVIAYPLHDPEHEFLRDVELAAPKHRFLQVTSSPVSVDGTHVGRIWTMRDITSEREITELKIQYGGARGADELKSKFLTVISHQMRTPLNSVRWNMELLIGDDYPQVQGEPKEIIQEAYKAVVNSISIVDDMLMAVDIEQRTLRLDKKEVSLEDILSKAIHGVSRSAELKGVKIQVRDLPKGVPKIFVDADKIEKVLSRLLDNAVHYTPKDGSITLAVRLEKNDLNISVADTGIGIPKEDQVRVFDRFYRSKDAIGLHPNASGLGLYISKFIVEAHDGKISFESAVGRGTTFSIILPKGQVPA